MTTCDEIKTSGGSSLSRMVRLLLFCMMQSAAVILVGFAALFLSFEPVWPAESPSATLAGPGDARSGSLLLRRFAARSRPSTHAPGRSWQRRSSFSLRPRRLRPRPLPPPLRSWTARGH